MHRWLRMGLLIALVASVVSWVGGPHAVVAQGTVYTDTMDGSTPPLLSTNSVDPSQFLFTYQNGQFVIQALQTDYSGDLITFPQVPELANVSVATDFAIGGDLTGKYAFVGCRAADTTSGYELDVHPEDGTVELWLIASGNSQRLASVVDTTNVNLGSANNRSEIRCEGSTITGIVNGQQILSVQDTTYTSGSTFIGAGKDTQATDQLIVGYDNLTITDLGGGVAAQPTQPAALPTAIPAQPTQPAALPTAIPAQPTVPALEPTQSATTDSGTTTQQTLTITDPRVDPSATLGDALLVSLVADPVAGPGSASTDLSNGQFRYLSSGVNLSEFYAVLSYTTPPATPAGSWAVGFTFWDDGQGNYYDIFIQVNSGAAKWGFGQATGNDYTLQQSGDLGPNAVDFTPGAQNFLGVVLYRGIVMLSGNSFELDATVDLGASTGSGDVEAEVGFLADDTATTETLSFSISNFSVWDLSAGTIQMPASDSGVTPAAAPTEAAALPTAIPQQPTQAALPTVALPAVESPTVASGSTASSSSNPLLQQIFESEKAAATASAPLFTSASGVLTQSADSFSIVPAGISAADVYVTATFANPADMSSLSNNAIGIRDLNTNQEFRFVITTDGRWSLSVGSAVPVLEGIVSNFDATPGATNTLEILASGATGILAINGQVIQQVDLSANTGAGDVYIASGVTAAGTVDQRQIPYSDFTVYQVQA